MIAGLFLCHTQDQSPYARHYLAGLLGRSARKNLERFTEEQPELSYQNLQQFLTDSPWRAEALWSWVGHQAVAAFDARQPITLLIDESAFAKKGRYSAGVARQYNGRLGKLENSQVGVFSALSQGSRGVLSGARLYLPEEWTEAPDRCELAGIPPAQQTFRTKNELAWELIAGAAADGLRFENVGMDDAYGRDQDLLLKIAGLGKRFTADVPHTQLVWGTCPKGLERPEHLTQTGARAVSAWWAEGQAGARPLLLRSGENGQLRVRFWRRRVWLWPPSSELPLALWLLVSVRRDGTVKYSLSNAPEETPALELALNQAQRYFVERTFEDGKSELGMGEYQIRQWTAWHHHMALVGAAMLFAFLERRALAGAHPLTSVRDVVEMVAWYFEQNRTSEDIVAQIQARHRRRTLAMRARQL